ncbi:hypothetical protein SDRG_05009 [Saprolegnia diclina VS20]|uniref:Uncharacterized protein n=1 Tax=Saprolegnia diclina (strain VS20) TaxID=1156394 RepID=T0QTS5_SAPDV|nr:hypothetical protein SDRG_05009 [Saprolegnia diclina VS20]EQC37405.1 hypothetical protein SDRG_05009 [Saprolegnia diclina VS20]|eukprot:XP_008608925.1 hypothetical protein SDRG_05009 [Saprolegnia diclina VS20]
MGEAQPLLAPSPLSDGPPAPRSCLSSMLFTWMNPLLELGNERPLEMDDLYQLAPALRADVASARFQACWDIERQRPHPSLARALARAFGRRFVAAGVLRLIRDVLQFVGPFVIHRVIAYLCNPLAPESDGLICVAAIFIAGNLQAFCFRNYMYYVFETGLLVRSAVVAAVYQKALRLSSLRSSGEITNLVAIDATRLQDLLSDLHAIWYGPCLIAAACTLLYYQVGPACFGALGVILLAIPLSLLISRRMRTLQKALMAVKDDRIKVCYEVLTGIKVIKLQTWEHEFVKRVQSFRDDELRKLKAYILTRASSNSIFNGAPALITVALFATYVVGYHEVLDVQTSITCLALLAIMRYPLFVLPSVVNAIVEASVSLTRLEACLLDAERMPVGSGDLKHTGISLQEATFGWTAPALGPLTLRIHDHGLVAVVGPVGSGKSTLLSGLLGDAHCLSGSVALRGNIAYVAQQPFIQNATVRDNICFGLPYEFGRYMAAIRVACLDDDLRALPGHDLTEIGEKGINLSGGQKTRVALARAVYQDADVYLLDDVLAAVDAHVGAAIYESCIRGTLGKKLVVLVTNALQFLPTCDQIVVLHAGRVAQVGAYDALLSAPASALQALVSSYTPPSVQDASTDDVISDDEFGTTPGHQLQRVPSSDVAEKARHLMVDEDRSTGDVAWRVYGVWVRACGGVCILSSILCVFFLAQGTNVVATFWLQTWAANDAQSSTNDRRLYLYLFVGLNLGYVALIFLRVLLLYIVGLRGSSALFTSMLYQVLRAPMAFFDTTPLGRIVNRLSKDVYAADEDIPATVGNVLITLCSVTATLATIVYVTPAFALGLLPLGVGYIASQRYFIKTSRELQRLESISRSPLYALMAETLDGLPTIRAYGVQSTFVRRMTHLLDRNQRAYFLNFSANCWLGLRLEFAGSMIASIATLCAVAAHSPTSTAFAGPAGVALSYAFSVTPSLNMSVRYLSQLQTQMVSIERLHAYATMPTEPPLRLPSSSPTTSTRGEIVFENVDLRYRAGLPRVLRQLSARIRPKEKIGVVGRTGAGKSSLVVALMRLVELQGGAIYIDGVNTASLGLHDLRSQISIIPQDPVLFSGTVRFNLDPFQQYADDAVWAAVKRAQLGSVTALDALVDERGCNFSVGERQLLCIARALLKQSRIILMDEATASIDPSTDKSIQRAIRDVFVDCTCLTIAHRLNTIMDADRILVLDHGAAVEFDTPSALLTIKHGIFASLVAKAAR